jgi:hypothetical protein
MLKEDIMLMLLGPSPILKREKASLNPSEGGTFSENCSEARIEDNLCKSV